jgi:tetratricopeptide (TPR) repeat protein
MSIVVREPQQHAFLRYRLPEMIREFGIEALSRSSDEGWLRGRHGEHYRRLTERVDADSMNRHQAAWLARLRLERANLRAAADHYLTDTGEATHGLQIITALARYNLAVGLISKGRYQLSRALDRSPEPGPTRAKALWIAGWLNLLQGHTTEGLALLRECRVLAQAIGDASALRRVVQFTGLAEIFQGRYDRAGPLLRQALAEHHAAGDDDGEWLALYQLALVSSHFGDHEQAIAYGERSVAICRARDAAWAEAHALWVTGVATLWCGDTERAGPLLREALRDKHALGDHWGMARCLEALAWALAPRRPADAARLLGAAYRLWLSIGSPPEQWRMLANSREYWRTYLEHVLGPDRFAEDFRGGHDLLLDEVVGQALGEPAHAR